MEMWWIPGIAKKIRIKSNSFMVVNNFRIRSGYFIKDHTKEFSLILHYWIPQVGHPLEEENITSSVFVAK